MNFLNRLLPENTGKYETLLRFKLKGYRPSHCVDIGAHEDTTELRILFSEAEHILVEPDKDRLNGLRFNYRRLSHSIFAKMCSDKAGDEYLSIDSLTCDITTEVLLKIDTDGNEMECLRSAECTLKQKKSRLVIVECTYDRVNLIIDYMSMHGYVLSGVCDIVLRGALFWQCDMIFVDQTLHDFLGAGHWHEKSTTRSSDSIFKVAYLLSPTLVLAKIYQRMSYSLSTIFKS